MAKYDENGNLIEDEEQKEGQEETQTPTPSTNVPKPSWREVPRNSWESYTSAWNRTNPLESDEDYEKRRRRTRASAIISSLGEGLSSMANLYYTTHYSPSAAPTNLSAGMLKRYNDMEADRAKNKEAWAKGYQQAKQLDEQKDERDRNWNLTLQQYLDNKGYKDADEKRKDENQRMSREKHDWEGQLQPSKRRQAEAQAGMAETDAKNKQRGYDDKHSLTQAQIAAANRSHRGGGSSSSGEKGEGGKYVVYHRDGRVTRTDSKSEWAGLIISETPKAERNLVYKRDKEGNQVIDENVLHRLNGRHLQVAQGKKSGPQYHYSGTTIGLGGDERGEEDNTPEFYK